MKQLLCAHPLHDKRTPQLTQYFPCVRILMSSNLNTIFKCTHVYAYTCISEDCLYLNVYAPANRTSTSNLPIMVFIHVSAHRTNTALPLDASTKFNLFRCCVAGLCVSTGRRVCYRLLYCIPRPSSRLLRGYHIYYHQLPFICFR